MENSDRFKLRDKPPPGMEMLADGKILHRLHDEVYKNGHLDRGLKRLVLKEDLDPAFCVSVRIFENVNNRNMTVIGPGGRNENDPDLEPTFILWDKRVGIVKIPFDGFVLLSASRVTELKEMVEVLEELYQRQGITGWGQLENDPKLDARLHREAQKYLHPPHRAIR
jgi:hypothetical protein